MKLIINALHLQQARRKIMEINNPLFNGLNAEAYEDVISNFTPVKYRKHECIFVQQDRLNYIYIVVDGLVEISRYSVEGVRSIVNLLEDNEMFAESFILAYDEPISPYYGTCLKDTDLLVIDVDHFSYICQTYPVIMFNMMRILATENTFLTFKTDCLSKNNIKDRVFELLRYYHIKQSTYQIQLPFNKNQLADFLGVNRSALSREMKKMAAENIFAYADRKYHLNDKMFKHHQ
jgi:CRP/FNR family transcriptional regulator, dissimilatory nitrate respiration regulator